MTSLWILRKNGKDFCPPRNGRDLPQVLVDMEEAHVIFAEVFPQQTVRAWGKGDYEVLVSAPDGSVTSLGPLEIQEVNIKEIREVIAPIEQEPLPSKDSPAFKLLLLNMQTPPHPGWAGTLRGLSKDVPEAMRPKNEEWEGIPPILQAPETGIQTALFLKGNDPKLMYYLRWISLFKYMQERFGGLTPQTKLTIALRMAYYAAALYLRESPRILPGLDQPVPLGDVHQEIIDELSSTASFLVMKDADYGQAFRRFGAEGVMVRAYDKFSRYTTLKSSETDPSFEPLLDSLKDMEGYSLILAGLFSEALNEILP